MIGAHPDDEDTQLIAWLARRGTSRRRICRSRAATADRISSATSSVEALGMIRTEELLAARRIDGGRQYFTRAFDFGFSKTLDETLQHWPKDSILEDVVAIVRAFRPHVIIAVFSRHAGRRSRPSSVRGVIAREVFDAAADTVRFPASPLGGFEAVDAAQVLSRCVAPRRRDARRSTSASTIRCSAQAYSEIATVSRSQHRSQGQGALPQRGPRFTAVCISSCRASRTPKRRRRGLFDGIDTTLDALQVLAARRTRCAARSTRSRPRRHVPSARSISRIRRRWLRRSPTIRD